MIVDSRPRIAILSPRERDAQAPQNTRFAKVYEVLNAHGMHVEPALYHDDVCAEVRSQIMRVDGVLVWFNPDEGGRDRAMLDAMLREVASAGVFVSAHPDIILKLGTKEVLYQTRNIGWGCDTHIYRSLAQLRTVLPLRLASGAARVLKQYRGSSGDGVWKVERAGNDAVPLTGESRVRARHAKRGSVEENISLGEFFQRCASYFTGDGRMIDQAYQPRLPEGMVRCYLVHDKVAGFGHQAINALCPAPPGAPPEATPQTTKRLYHPPSMPEFQALKLQLERVWVPAMQKVLDIETNHLPVLWDCDFLLGPKNASGDDTYVLCEINVSSVSPFPDSAIAPIAVATLARSQAVKRQLAAVMRP
ncbi:MAG TPA: Cj0069 family protein [Burkholderiales bacterium]|nr:Cj0069 family protein [Burkholderiales bacterium]